MKTELVGVRLSIEQKKILEKEATSRGISIQEYMRNEALNSVGNKPDCTEVDEQDEVSAGGFVNTYVSLPADLDKKVCEKADELGATKQECIRRLIKEGNVYDLRINIDLEEEFLSLTSQVKALNNMISGIYTVVKKSDGVFTKREVDHMYEVMHEIRDSTNKILSSVYKTCAQVKEMANRRMVKLIKEKTGR